MPFVNDQPFIDKLYSTPKKYIPFQDKQHIKKEKKFKYKIKKDLLGFVEMVQREVQEGKRQPVDINTYTRWNVDIF